VRWRDSQQRYLYFGLVSIRYLSLDIFDAIYFDISEQGVNIYISGDYS